MSSETSDILLHAKDVAKVTIHMHVCTSNHTRCTVCVLCTPVILHVHVRLFQITFIHCTV